MDLSRTMDLSSLYTKLVCIQVPPASVGEQRIESTHRLLLAVPLRRCCDREGMGARRAQISCLYAQAPCPETGLRPIVLTIYKTLRTISPGLPVKACYDLINNLFSISPGTSFYQLSSHYARRTESIRSQGLETRLKGSGRSCLRKNFCADN
jgi:hypothetical protein